jgi:GMP synthase-like glutamine amidotransferase
MRILVIQHDDDSGLGTMAAPLADAGCTLENWVAHRKAAPDRPVPDYDGVIVLGGIVNPDEDDEHQWLATERYALREALDLGIPTLGICLGGQLLAQTAGGQAPKAERPEIGWFPLRATPALDDDPLFCDFPAEFESFEWHHYRFDLPPGAVLLAANDNVNQAFRVGRAWGTQFHIEVKADMVLDWLVTGAPDALAHGADIDAIRAETIAKEAPHAELAGALARRFAAEAAAYRGTR